MLRDLHISDLGVIDSAHIEVAPGLNVLTGETGAGKTMVVDALTLLLGERADGGAVRAGRASAVIEASLAVHQDDSAAVGALTEAGLEPEDGELVAARQVLASGRSRASLQGRMVTASTLSEVMRPLVEVHGQHEFQGLLRPGVQLDLLDRFAGDEVVQLRTRWGRAWRRLRQVSAELEALTSRAREREREAEVLRYQLAEIEAAGVRVGEEAELREEADRLSHVETLREAAEGAHQVLAGTDDEGGAAAAIGQAARWLAGPGGHDQAVADLGGRAAGLAADAGELASDLRAYIETLQADPARLAQVHERLALLRELQRKYGEDEAAILAFAETATARLGDLEGGTVRSEALEQEAGTLRKELAELGPTLTGARAHAAERLEAAVVAELVELSMANARFLVRVVQDDPATETGPDRAEFELAANPGAPLRPLAKAASGGELARVMLALRVVLAGIDRTSTLIFDEVDAGVGGRTAASIGRRLALLARTHQVLVVTHLPQIAAYADRHFLVEKRVAEGTTTTVVQALDDGTRRTELSRMLSGMTESDLAQAHAEELLSAANQAKRADAAGPARPGW